MKNLNPEEKTMDSSFPIGGSRLAVYDALRSRGFVMSQFSDKHWVRSDGLSAHVYGAGSRLSLRRDNAILADGPMAETLTKIDEMDRATAQPTIAAMPASD